MAELPFFVSIPHSGEEIPAEAHWLRSVPPHLLLRDIDRFVDRLYLDHLRKLEVPTVITPWTRYAIDLNRFEHEIDAGSVEGAPLPPATHQRGLHWQMTTLREPLMSAPMSWQQHEDLKVKCFFPFHKKIQDLYQQFFSGGFQNVYHLDAHSMPSVGTSEHKDPGQLRADVVVSDFHGRSCASEFRDLVVSGYEKAGFKVALNWPYFGGGVTQTYGKPEIQQHAIQVELNRSLYMNEKSKEPSDQFSYTHEKIGVALNFIHAHFKALKF